MKTEENQEELLEQSQALNKLLLEVSKTQKENNSALVKLFMCTITCLTAIIVAGIIGFFWYESQFETSVQTLSEETITQEVSGTDSEINNVEGDMYKDNAIHNQGEETN